MPATRMVKVQLVEDAERRGLAHGRPAEPGITQHPIEGPAARTRGCRAFPRPSEPGGPHARRLP